MVAASRSSIPGPPDPPPEGRLSAAPSLRHRGNSDRHGISIALPISRPPDLPTFRRILHRSSFIFRSPFSRHAPPVIHFNTFISIPARRVPLRGTSHQSRRISHASPVTPYQSRLTTSRPTRHAVSVTPHPSRLSSHAPSVTAFNTLPPSAFLSEEQLRACAHGAVAARRTDRLNAFCLES